MGACHRKGQLLLTDELVGKENADALGKDGCQGRACGTKRKDRDHKEVKDDV